MTDRDTFAAAALTGLLAQGDDGSFSEESYVRAAYRWADAMLRERERTNHDAAPAAIAEDLGTGDTPVTEPIPKEKRAEVSGGSKPVGWAVMDGTEFMEFCTEEEAKGAVKYYGGRMVPLYRHPQPTLTDAERMAIAWASEMLDVGSLPQSINSDFAATMRGLLERMK